MSLQKLTTNLERDKSFTPTKIYEKWYKMKVMVKDPEDTSKIFSLLFQNCQVRTTSEAMAETTGSIMVNHIGKGRYLQPANFNKEIVLEFNLGPPFLLEGLARRMFCLRRTNYLYKKKPDGSFATRISRLKDLEHGCTITNYRNRQVDKSHLPVDLWTEGRVE